MRTKAILLIQGNFSTKSAFKLAASEAVSSLVKSSEAETLELRNSSISSSISSSSRLTLEVSFGVNGFSEAVSDNGSCFLASSSRGFVIDNAGAGVSATSEMKIRKPFYFSQLVPSNFQNKGFKAGVSNSNWPEGRMRHFLQSEGRIKSILSVQGPHI